MTEQLNDQSAEKLNGAASATQAQKIEALLAAGIRQVVGTMFRGIMVSAPGVPPHVVMNLIAKESGKIMAEAVNGELAAVLQLRTGFKKMFENGVNSVPSIRPLPGAQMSVMPPAQG